MFFRNLLTILIPQKCIQCGSFQEKPLCQSCLGSWSLTLNKGDNLSHDIDNFYYLSDYHESAIKRWLHNIKYASNKALSNEIAFKIKNVLSPLLNNGYLCIPIPLHKKRRKKRSFNQVEALFYPSIQNSLSWYCPILERKKNTQALSKLSKEERENETKDAFHIHYKDLLENRAVLLIDDIVTTGSTVSSVAKIIKKNGARQVDILSLAYTKLQNST